MVKNMNQHKHDTMTINGMGINCPLCYKEANMSRFAQDFSYTIFMIKWALFDEEVHSPTAISPTEYDLSDAEYQDRLSRHKEFIIAEKHEQKTRTHSAMWNFTYSEDEDYRTAQDLHAEQLLDEYRENHYFEDY